MQSTWPLNNYIKDTNKNFPAFTQPCVIGYFTLNDKREYKSDLSGLSYYCHKGEIDTKIRFDLNLGYENYIRKSETDNQEGIKWLLRYILLNFYDLKSEDDISTKILKDDIVCFRGLMTLVMTTLYLKENWTIWVTKWKNTLYLNIHKKPEGFNNDNADRFCYWGRKFEKYVFANSSNQSPDIMSPVNESEEFCCLFRAKLNNYRLLYGAEMDGVISNFEIENIEQLRAVKFVEVKTARHCKTQRQEFNFSRFKLIKYWCQSFLVGIKDIIIGRRDDKGNVTKIENLQMKQIQTVVKGIWSPNVVTNFLEDFFRYVNHVIGESDDPYQVFEFKYDQNENRIECKKLLKDPEHRVLAQWYVDGLSNIQS